MNRRTKKTELDKIKEKLRQRLSAETTNIWEIGQLLIKARQQLELEHGEWMPLLAQNFDLSYRTALRYIKVEEYRRSKIATVANLMSLSPSVLYALVEGEYNEEEEAAILAETAKKGGHRIDVDKANEIIFALVPLEPEPKAEPDDEPDSDDPADSDDDDLDAILDGPPPELTPTEHSNPAAAEQNDHLAGSGNGRIQKAVARAFIASLRFRFALLNVRQRGTTDARSRPWKCAECSHLFRRTALAEVGQDFCWPRRGRKNLGVTQSSYQNSQFWRHTARHFQFSP